MYNLLFWFFYKFDEKYKGSGSAFLPTFLVGLAMIFHLGLIHAIVRYFTGFTVGTFSDDYVTNKLILLPIVFVLFFIFYKLYYQPRTDKILEKYKDKNPFSLKYILLIVVIMVIPLVAAAILTNMAVKKFK